ncbi:MAG: glycosyltransferase [Bacteroidetes bacterium]|nr:glycosyltransferase [Bacteroidota bacterium]
MNLLFVSHDNYGYGATQSLLTLLKGIRNGFPEIRIEVLLPGNGFLNDQLNRLTIPYYQTPVPRWMLKKKDLGPINRIKALARTFRAAWRLKNRYTGAHRPDFIISNTSVSGLGFMLAKLTGARHVLYVREFGRVDYYLEPAGGTFQMKIACRFSDRVVVNSEAVKNWVSTVYKTGGAVTVYNGFDPDQFPVKQMKPGDRPFTVAQIAAFSPGKGHSLVLEAFARFLASHPDSRLILAGDGDLSLVTSNPAWPGLAESVSLPGFVEKISDVFSLTDAVIVASDAEAFGRVTAEAMLSGVPVIGRKTGGTPELIRHGETGLLFGTATELEESLELLFANPGLKEKIGGAAREFARGAFSIESYTRNFIHQLT